jgi:hypothetical protein
VTYAVTYVIESNSETHVRYYHALNKRTALEMFKATCEETLAGERASVLKVSKVKEHTNKA